MPESIYLFLKQRSNKTQEEFLTLNPDPVFVITSFGSANDKRKFRTGISKLHLGEVFDLLVVPLRRPAGWNTFHEVIEASPEVSVHVDVEFSLGGKAYFMDQASGTRRELHSEDELTLREGVKLVFYTPEAFEELICEMLGDADLR